MTDLIVVQRSPTIVVADGPAVPVPHAASHRSGGSDSLAADFAALAHASQHAPGGTDELLEHLWRSLPRVTALDNFSRHLTLAQGSQGSGSVQALIFKPSRDFTATKITMCSGTATPSSVSVARLGVGLVTGYANTDENTFSGSIQVSVTPLVETASNTGLFAAANTVYANNALSTARGLAASIAFDSELEYAVYVIGVSAGTNIGWRGIQPAVTSLQYAKPVLIAGLAAQADLPTAPFVLNNAGGHGPWARFHV